MTRDEPSILRTADSYEEVFMDDAQGVLFREKMFMPMPLRVGLPLFIFAQSVLFLVLAFTLPFPMPLDS